jgi:hypothetical protein
MVTADRSAGTKTRRPTGKLAFAHIAAWLQLRSYWVTWTAHVTLLDLAISPLV